MRSPTPTPRLFAAPESMRPTLMGRDWMVCGGHPLTAEVAARVFAAGGNAIDAGVAAGLASNVVQVDMCSLGGIAPIVLRSAGASEPIEISGVGTWGAGVTVEDYSARYGASIPLGAGAAVVPAALDAWVVALAHGGTWSFADAVAPAIDLAERGFPLDARTAATLTVMGATFGRWPSSREVLWPRGRPPRAGERLVQPALARTLKQLADAERGGDRAAGLEAVRGAFYEGPIAERIAAHVTSGGGWMSTADLADFRSEIGAAAHRGCFGWEVWTSGPYSQGPAMLQAMAVLEQLGITNMEPNGPEYLHALVEAIKLAFSDRERYYGDPRFVDVGMERLLSDAHAAELATMFDPTRALPNLPTMVRAGGVWPAQPGETRGAPRHDTTHLCTIDAAGNVFTATPSDTADGGPIVAELGFVVSPRGVQSRLDPGHAAVLGPGRRPRTTPASAMAIAPDGAAWAFGCPGGDVIVQAMLQAFVNHAVFGFTLQEAVEAPRVAAFSFPGSFHPHVELQGRVAVESRIPEAVRRELSARGHDVEVWDAWDFDMGSVGMTRAYAGGDPRLEGAADPRRCAYAIGA